MNELAPYRAKRDFRRTPELEGAAATRTGARFVVHKHAATRLHYDLRLEIGGVLKSWAVTKGPSLDPKVKRLAVHVEDHPLSYTEFEGWIPKGQYGGGAMIVWDRGTWVPLGDLENDYQRGELKFRLDGEKLQGGWALVRLKGTSDVDKGWLLIKERDIFAAPGAQADVTGEAPLSVLSGLSTEAIEAEPADDGRERKPLARKRRRKQHPERLAGAKRAVQPEVPAPLLASLADEPPAGTGWIHEIKFDGYRTLCRLADGEARLLTRNGHDWTDRYGPVAESFAALPCRQATIDGELCVQNAKGVTSFSDLREALSEGATERLVFFAFDLLYLDGFDLTRTPLSARKSTLRVLIESVVGDRSPIQYSDHVAGDGAAFLAEAARLSLEGIISKREDSAYAAGRSSSWLKTKCVAAERFLVVGYTRSAAAGGLGALLAAEPVGDGLAYVGKIGTGYSTGEMERLLAALEPLRRDDPVFTLVDPPGEKAVWVEPQLLVEVQYRARTREGRLRGAVYKGLRSDTSAPAVARKGYVSDADLASIWVTNPDRRMFGKGGPTKLDLALYYAQVADWIVPEMVSRPVTLVRCPTGKADDVFYQRHAMPGMPQGVREIALREEGSKERADYIYIEDGKGLLSLSQFGVIEFHPWGCRVDKPEWPDRLIFDLDPDEALEWREVADAAHHIRDELAALGLVAFVRTTGGKGLHVVVPVERRTAWPAFKGFAQAFVLKLAAQSPNRYTASMSKKSRQRRIFIDYLRNGRGATAAASYSLRARTGFPVATPVDWAELSDIDDPAEFNYASVPDRLASLAVDPWRALEGSARRLTRAMEEKLGIHKPL